MRNFVRWAIFTATTTLIWLVGGFTYLVLSRHYESLQVPAFMVSMLFLMSAASAIAAISLAQKMDEEPAEPAPTRREPRFTASKRQR